MIAQPPPLTSWRIRFARAMRILSDTPMDASRTHMSHGGTQMVGPQAAIRLRQSPRSAWSDTHGETDRSTHGVHKLQSARLDLSLDCCVGLRYFSETCKC